MKGSRVVVTGLGAVTAFGSTVDALWQACRAGDTRVAAVPDEWQHYYASRSRIWSPLPLPDFTAAGFSRADVLSYDPVVLNALVAADNAIDDAGLERVEHVGRERAYLLEGVDRDRAGVFIGTGLGCISSAFNNYVPHLLGSSADELFSDDRRDSDAVAELGFNLSTRPRVNPFASCQSMANAIASMISIRYGLRGAAETQVYACAAGTAAIARAFRAIQHGELDIAVAGGSEYYGDRAGGVFMAFDRLRALVQDADPPESGNRPFDRDRSGFLFSQGGAGVLVLESEAHARKRGIDCDVSIRGMSITSDSYSLAAMTEEDNAIELMLKRLLRDADVSEDRVGYINAHGTSTVQNDPIEAGIIARVFPGKPVVNSTKSILGHTIGASGALEAIVTVISMREGCVHGTRNLENPIADLRFATETVPAEIEFAVSQSFGFGGHNVGILMEHHRS